MGRQGRHSMIQAYNPYLCVLMLTNDYPCSGDTRCQTFSSEDSPIKVATTFINVDTSRALEHEKRFYFKRS